MPPATPFRVMILLELTEAYAQAILRGVCRRGGQDPRLRLHTTRMFPLTKLPLQMDCCDAVIASLVDESVCDVVLRRRWPVVNVSNRGTDFHSVSVVSDIQGAFKRSVQHLQERGLHRIASLCKVSSVEAQSPTQAEHFSYLGAVPFGEGARLLDPESISRAGAWLKQHELPIAVVCSSDALAAALAEICERNGLSVPEDVAIVGCGNDEVACLSDHPPLSSVDMQFEGVGCQAVEVLVDLLEGRGPESVMRVVPTGPVVVRQSSNVYAVNDPYVSRALKIMDEHRTGALDIGDLAEMLHISRRMFEHRFQKVLHVAPATYLRMRRLRRAAEMLENRDKHITEIAYAAGFANAAHFCTLFRKWKGMTPKHYRESVFKSL